MGFMALCLHNADWLVIGKTCADARWGKVAHITFFFFCFATNIIVTAMLILGGASVMNALTGMDIYAVRPLGQ